MSLGPFTARSVPDSAFHNRSEDWLLSLTTGECKEKVIVAPGPKVCLWSHLRERERDKLARHHTGHAYKQGRTSPVYTQT